MCVRGAKNAEIICRCFLLQPFAKVSFPALKMTVLSENLFKRLILYVVRRTGRLLAAKPGLASWLTSVVARLS